MAILGEGNASARVDGEVFLVKASGSELGTLKPDQIVAVRSKKIIAMLDQNLDDDDTPEALLAARVAVSGGLERRPAKSYYSACPVISR